ncbi:hypothetical protein N9D31_01595 [Oligoflexaceae bacterium]|nr:hypothetical protein [Oligoflexaceae bacterium]
MFVTFERPWSKPEAERSTDPAEILRSQISKEIEGDFKKYLLSFAPAGWELDPEHQLSVEALVNLRPKGESFDVARVVVDISLFDRDIFPSFESHAASDLKKKLAESKYKSWVWPQSDVLTFKIIQYQRGFLNTSAYVVWMLVLAAGMLLICYLVLETFFYWRDLRRTPYLWPEGSHVPAQTEKSWDEQTFHYNDIHEVSSEKINPKLMRMPLGQLREFLMGLNGAERKKMIDQLDLPAFIKVHLLKFRSEKR